MYKLKLETKISSFHDSNFEHVWLKSVIVVPGQIHDVATLRVAEEANLKSCGLKMGEIINNQKSCPNQLPAERINTRGNDLCWFDQVESNWQHFQPTLHNPKAT